MARINTKLTMLQTEYYQLLPELQEHFQIEFMKFNKCALSTFYRRMRKGDSLDDLALFQYVFGKKIFSNDLLIEKRFKSTAVKKYVEKNQLNIYDQMAISEL
jgi:hypothetical protein